MILYEIRTVHVVQEGTLLTTYERFDATTGILREDYYFGGMRVSTESQDPLVILYSEGK